MECNFVLVNEQGRKIDVHSYNLDEAGNNVPGVPYLPEHLTENGLINVTQLAAFLPGGW